MEGVLGWLRARADVDGTRIGMFGVSKGAEFALAAASRMSGFAAVAAIVPTDVIWEGWGPGTSTGRSSGFSWRGVPLAFVPYQGMDAEIAKLSRGEPGDLRRAHDAGRAAFADRIAPARIAVEAIAAPVLVAGGDRDRDWNSGGMTTAIAAARHAAGLPTVALVFPDAGHSLSGDGIAPDAPADARAQSVVDAATLAFFERHLRPARAPAPAPAPGRVEP